ncbi:MAG: hypothetical protein F6K31_33660 [Symploca sp. SIO2G7]|nr:hypothetical protein [Symploca sp. SIO2G7]
MLAGYAKANADNGVVAVALKCGYGNNVWQFVEALQSACTAMGIDNEVLSALMAEHCQIQEQPSASIADRWRKYLR